MASDYTVIQAVRQRFGDKEKDFEEMPIELTGEKEAPFVGVTKDFPFSCPNVDRAQTAILQFISYGIASSGGTLEINGVGVSGGLSSGGQGHELKPRLPLWNAHFLLVAPNVLSAQNNVLRILSRPDDFGNRDNFVIDNIVVFYKTLGGGSPGGDVVTT